MTRKDKIISFLKESPLDSFLLFALAKEFEKEENFVEAIKIYSSIEENDPKYVGLYYHLGKAYEEEALENEAISTYKKGLAIAKSIEDQHAHAEIQNALTNLELGI